MYPSDFAKFGAIAALTWTQADAEPIETTFELNDTLFAKAEIPHTDEVYLWLGVRLRRPLSLPHPKHQHPRPHNPSIRTHNPHKPCPTRHQTHRKNNRRSLTSHHFRPTSCSHIPSPKPKPCSNRSSAPRNRAWQIARRTWSS